MDRSSVIVGLAGGSATGKTTIVDALTERFSSEELCVISQDHYYKPLTQQLRDDKGEINFDHPAGIDFKRIRSDIRTLNRGKSVDIVEYTFNNPEVFPKQIRFSPAGIILIEGLFAFADPYLNRMYGYRVYIEADMQVALDRRLRRDTEERGMTHSEVHYQWEKHVMPAYNEFLFPHRDKADLVIDNTVNFEPHLDRLETQLRALL